MSLDDAHAGGGDQLPERRCLERPGGQHAIKSDGKRGAGPGNGCRARAAIGLEHIAVEDDGTLAERLHVDHGAQRASNEPLNLMGTTTDLAALRFAGRAGQRGARQHAVLSGNPSPAAVAQPRGNSLLNRGIAQHPRVADFDQNRAFGGSNEAGSEANRAELGGGSPFGAKELLYDFHRCSLYGFGNEE